MSYGETFNRVKTLALELWSAQQTVILTLAALGGLVVLLPQQMGMIVSLLVALVQATLSVYWLKAGARSGSLDAASLQKQDKDWPSYLGVGLGIFASIFLAVLIFFPLFFLGLPGVVVYAFLTIIAAFLVAYYTPKVQVQASGFMEALKLLYSLIISLAKREYFFSSKLWYPISLYILAGAISAAVLAPAKHGAAAAILTFLFDLIFIPVGAAVMLVVYENIWKEDEPAAAVVIEG